MEQQIKILKDLKSRGDATIAKLETTVIEDFKKYLMKRFIVDAMVILEHIKPNAATLLILSKEYEKPTEYTMQIVMLSIENTIYLIENSPQQF